jgi:hypothetical protein
MFQLKSSEQAWHFMTRELSKPSALRKRLMPFMLPGSPGPIICGLLGDWKKLPFDDQRHSSFKMVARTTAIVGLVSVDYLTNA